MNEGPQGPGEYISLATHGFPLCRLFLIFAVTTLMMIPTIDAQQPTSPVQHPQPPFFDNGVVYPAATLAHSHILVQYADMANYGDRLIQFWDSWKVGDHYSKTTVRLVNRAQSRTRSAIAELRQSTAVLGDPIPVSPDTHPARQTRQAPGINVNLDVGSGVAALFHGIRSLFMWSDMDDLKATQQHLIHRTDILADDFRQMNEFITNLTSSVLADFVALRNITDKIHRDQILFEHAVLIADAFDTVSNFCQRLSRAIQSLASGRLTTDLVTISDADLLLTNLADQTSTQGLNLGVQDALNFYLSKFTVTVTDTLIDVLVSIPAFDPSRPFNLYEFSPVPMVPPNYQLAPGKLLDTRKLLREDQILEDPLWLVESASWIAVSDGLPNERETAVWTDEEFKTSCHRFSATEYYCSNTFVIKDASSSCLPALFLGLPTFASICDFNRAVSIKPLFKFTTSGHLVTYHQDETPMEVTCGRHHSYHTLYQLNSFEPPPGCSLATPVWSLPALPSISATSEVFIPKEYEDLQFGTIDELPLTNVSVFEDHSLHIETLPALRPPTELPTPPLARRTVPWISLGLAVVALAAVASFLVYLFLALRRMHARLPQAPIPMGPDDTPVEEERPLNQEDSDKPPGEQKS